jgi:Flp pilus assembly secretin CpaC
MGVLTGGVLGLGLGLFNRTEIPGAVRYSRVFDNGAREIVIAVTPEITQPQLEATLQQAASDLFSPGRVGRSDQFLTIRARALIHPEPGVSEPVYIGEVKRSIYNREDNNQQIQVFQIVSPMSKTINRLKSRILRGFRPISFLKYSRFLGRVDGFI